MKIAVFAVAAMALALAGCARAPNVTIGSGGEVVLHRSVAVASGGEVRLDFAAAINEDCSPVLPLPTVRVAREPEHGTIRARRVDDHPVFFAPNPRKACNVRKVPGNLVTYQAARGWVGVDHVAYDMFYPLGRQFHIEVDVHVK
ncbi:hypothetical protein EYW49_20995 [Siculibacillus lacustris]|uniref:Lipoprotein n=1 Tax=Siculibacillus lacustris TaxID=1549641 RepID=A0A4Q9VEF9_9HYPH|nr:hypothetical protein [Siculibacillus lacustris]TBW33004.1 hypothetical protein EYW49_20995 [Siculibacillus lacustris]